MQEMRNAAGDLTSNNAGPAYVIAQYAGRKTD